MTNEEEVMPKSRTAVSAMAAIRRDIEDRRGLNDAWESIDPETKRGIENKWIGILEDHYGKQ